MIVCPNLPKEYIERAKQALNTDKEITIEASYVQWLQNHPDEDRLPSMDELKEFNTSIQPSESPKEEKTFAEKLLEYQVADEMHTKMLAEVSAQSIQEFSRMIQQYYDNTIEAYLREWQNDETKSKLLTGNLWIDKATIAKTYTPQVLLRKVRATIQDNYLDDEKLALNFSDDEIPYVKDKATQCLKYFNQLIPYAAVYIKRSQPVSVSNITVDYIDPTEDELKLDEASLLEHWQIEHLETSVFATLDPITKDVISHLTDDSLDEDGDIVSNSDSMGNEQLKSPIEVTRKLIDVIGSCTSAEEMIPSLVDAAEQDVWMWPLVDVLTGKNPTAKNADGNDEETFHYYADNETLENLQRQAQNLQALFWRDFHKPFLALATLNEEGFTITNRDSTLDNTALQQIQNNISAGEASSDKIYGVAGTLNLENYQKVFDKLREGNKVYAFMTAKDRDKVKNYDEEINTIVDTLHAIGLDVEKTSVVKIFRDNDTAKIQSLQSVLFNNIFNARQTGNAALQGLIKDSSQSVFSAFFKSYKTLTEIFALNTPKDERRVFIDVDGETKTLFGNVIPNSIMTTFSKFHQSPAKVKQFIENNYLYDFHYKNAEGHIPNVWLRELYEGNVQHNSLVEPIQLVASYGSSYMRETDVQAALTRLEAYFRGKETVGNNTTYSIYSVGTFADAKASYYIRNKVRSSKECIEAITDMFISEIDRIEYCKAKKKAMERTAKAVEELPKNASIEDKLKARQQAVYEIENFDNKDYFLIFPALAPKTQEILDALKDMTPTQQRVYCKTLVTEQLRDAFRSYMTKLSTLGISLNSEHEAVSDRLKSFTNQESFSKDLGEFFLNQFLANLCIDNMFSVDYAFFKNTGDVQKRRKMFYSPTQTAYTSLYMQDENGQIGRVQQDISKDDLGNPIEYFVLLADNDLASFTEDHIKSALKQRVGTYLTQEQYNQIVKGIGDIKLTDGQAFRMLSSWRKLMNMLGQGQDERTQRAIEKLLNGTWDYEAYQCTFNVWKPFVSSYMKVDTGITQDDAGENFERYSTIKVPTMHKNSEFLLLAMYHDIQGIVKQSPKLVALNKFMSDFNIDKAQFVSANKVGNHGAINLNIENYGTLEEGIFVDDDGKAISPKSGQNIWVDKNTGNYYKYDFDKKSWEPIKDYSKYLYGQLCLACGVDPRQPHPILFKQGYNTNVVHYSPLSDWGIITNLPEHLIEHETGGLGTQLIKIVTENTPDKATVKFNLAGETKSLSGQEAVDVFQHLLVDYVEKAFVKIDKTFNNPVELRKFIEKSLAAQTKVSEDLINCLSIDPTTGKFVLSPLNPIRNAQFLSFCMSLIRKEMVRRRIKQGLLPQVSNYGLEDKLLLRYQDVNGHMIFTQKEFSGTDKVDPRHAEWLKAMQEKYPNYRAYAKSSDGKGNSILYMEVAVPLYDKLLYKFVDKETGHFDTNSFEKAVSPEAREALGYRTPTEAKHSMIPMYIKQLMPFQNASCIMTAADWVFLSGSDFDSDKLFTILPELEFIQSKATGEVISISPKQFKLTENGTLHDSIISSIGKNSLASNNNLLLDLLKGFLQMPENTSQVLTPNGYATLDNSVAVMDVLKSPEVKVVKVGSNDFESKRLSASKFDEVLHLSTDELERLASSTTEAAISPASPELRISEQVQNMVGLQMVAINAIFRVFTPLMQKTNAWVRSEVNNNTSSVIDKIPFTLNGNKSITDANLSRTKNIEGRLITDLISEILGASVDNAKDPKLGKFGATLELVPYLMYLFNRGYNMTEVGLFFNQPIIKDVLTEYNLNNGEKSLRDCILDRLSTVMSDSEDFGGINESQISNIVQKCQLSTGDLAYCINATTRGVKDFSVDETQYIVLRMFQKLIPAVTELNDVARYCRNSTFGGAASSFEDELFVKRLGYENTIDMYSKDTAPIRGLTDLLGNGIDLFEDSLREHVLLKADTLLQNISPLFNGYVGNLLSAYSLRYSKRNVISADEVSAFRDFSMSHLFARIYLDPATSPYKELLNKLNFFYNVANGTNNQELTPQSVSINLLLGVPRLLNIMRNRGILTEEPNILSTLVVQSNKRSGNLPQVRVLGNKHNPEVSAKVMNAWRDLYDKHQEVHSILYNDNLIEFTNKDIADLLFLYTIQTTGIVPKFNNFIDLFPSGYERLIPQYEATCENLKFNEEEQVDTICRAYIENNLSTSSAVQKVKYSTLRKALGVDKDVDVLPSQIRVERDSEGVIGYPFGTRNNYYAYLDIVDDNENHSYYQASEEESGTVLYTRISPKGIPNTFVEYFGTTSVVPSTTIMDVAPQVAEAVMSTGTDAEANLQQLFGDQVEASIINIDKVSNDLVDDTGMKICVTIKRH